jgi:hypothetical protein
MKIKSWQEILPLPDLNRAEETWGHFIILFIEIEK